MQFVFFVNFSAEKENIEFIDVCEKYLGGVGKFVAFFFGLAAFIGAIMVYWVLMSNFLYKVGVFIHGNLKVVDGF